MSDSTWIHVLRTSQDRFAAVLSPLSDTEIEGRSYDTEWTIAHVASHLGSQADIFTLALEAGLSGVAGPGVEKFHPIWDRWNAKTPREQVDDGVTANEALVSRIESLSEADRERFSVSMFGRALDLDGMAGVRLSEHAVHTWDIEVALDPSAQVAADAVALLIDLLPGVAGRAGKPVSQGRTLAIQTTEPERSFTLTTGPEVALTPGADGDPDLRLPAEALLRLVYGRLDPDHSPADLAQAPDIVALRRVFQGF
ncbi:MAG TPA: maleylpyruvate isomerase family mycothiol-dependent enzyme [Pseudonocardiaceae bacterium]|nr:maleylpyruvate isomerase family mycothiol-dependent enzyme [Pseudonocardiaceae bacterium]